MTRELDKLFEKLGAEQNKMAVIEPAEVLSVTIVRYIFTAGIN